MVDEKCKLINSEHIPLNESKCGICDVQFVMFLVHISTENYYRFMAASGVFDDVATAEYRSLTKRMEEMQNEKYKMPHRTNGDR